MVPPAIRERKPGSGVVMVGLLIAEYGEVAANVRCGSCSRESYFPRRPIGLEHLPAHPEAAVLGYGGGMGLHAAAEIHATLHSAR